jgi:hypothetical protein
MLVPPTSANPPRSDPEHYQAIVAEIQTYIDGFAAPLRAQARPFFENLAQSEFSRVVALLPVWLADLLPVAPNICHQLGVAHLYGWWYYAAQDRLLDGEAPAAALLGGHLALLKMVEIYCEVGLGTAPYWADFQQLALTSAELYALELQTRFTALAELTPAHLAPLTVEFIMDRGAPFYFNTLAQLHLAGVDRAAPLREDLIAALRCFTAARQIGDDAGDWLDDLRAGHLKYVSARLIRRLYDSNVIAGAADLDLERLAGYQIGDEAFWDEIEQTSQQLYRRALDHLAPYSGQLRGLIRHQMTSNAEHWAAGRAQRATIREMFGVYV